MILLSDCIRELQEGSNHNKVSKIIQELKYLRIQFSENLFPSLTESNTRADKINDLRKHLQQIVLCKHIDKKFPNLRNVVHKALLKLAEFQPLNEFDFSTYEPINTKYQVFSSTGHQFDIRELITFHNKRPARDDLNEEVGCVKWLINPYQNIEFSRRDFLHLRAFAKEKKLNMIMYINTRKHKEEVLRLYLYFGGAIILFLFCLLAFATEIREEYNPFVNLATASIGPCLMIYSIFAPSPCIRPLNTLFDSMSNAIHAVGQGVLNGNNVQLQ